MLTQIIWWAGIALESLLLVRGVRGGLVRRFPLFYTYVFFVLAESLVMFAVYRWARNDFARAYWIGEYGTLTLGSFLLLDVYRVVLRQYPGTARVARNLLCFVFALAFAKVLVNRSYGALWWSAQTPEELERNLRIVQSFAVLAIIIVMIVYAIPRGRDLKGILAGYSLLVGSSLVHLSLASHPGLWVIRTWSYVEPVCYVIVLCIWTVALWRPAEAISRESSLPPPEMPGHAALVRQTQEALDNLRNGLLKEVRR